MGHNNGRPRLSLDSLKWARRPTMPDEPDGAVRSRSLRRTKFMGGVTSIGMLALLIKSSSLMMFPDPQIGDKAQTQFKEAREIHGRRGEIRSRDGVLLATSVEVQSLHADPSKLTKDTAKVLAHEIAPLLDLAVLPTHKRLSARHRQDVLLARDLVPDKVDAILERIKVVAADHPTLKHVLFTRNEYRRFYPATTDAAPLLGVVGRMGTGLAGLERSLDRQLHGETYKYVQWRDRKGRRVTTDAPEARPGNSIVLTIDRRIQRIAEAALDNVMERSEPESAYVVVMDPKTGEILALAQRPTHNPNDTRKLKVEALRSHPVTDVYEPGSVFKPFIAAAAVEENIVSADSTIDCENGRFKVGRTTIRDDHPKKVISVTEVIKYSSNIGAVKLAFSLGKYRTHDYLSRFGFGRPTQIGLANEAIGYLRSPETIKPIELATTSYGHGANASALQLAAAVSVLGNDGVRMEPFVLKEIQDDSGSPIRIFEPKIDRRVISEETARSVINMMVTVTEKGGTGTQAAIPGYRVAGKTGTALKYMDGGYSKTERIGSFIGLVPADNPRLAMSIVVDGPSKGSRYGGTTAGPVFSEIATSALRLMGVPPDPALIDAKPEPQIKEDLNIPTGVPELRWAERGRLITPDLSGLSMRDALVTLQGAGLGIRIEGSGRVIQQSPQPGRAVRPGEQVEVVLQ
jgi:cell division protein FtsI (penicillin-binding protein 3)